MKSNLSRRRFLTGGGALVSAVPLLARGIPATRSSVVQWDNQERTHYFTDLTVAGPRSAFSSDGESGTWKVIPYETSALKGKMIFSSPGSQAPQLRLRINSKGWHAICLGINYNSWKEQLLKVKLSSDATFSTFVNESLQPKDMLDRTPATDYLFREKQSSELDVAEAFWKAVELQGNEELVIARKEFVPSRLNHFNANLSDTNAGIAYVKLVPLSDREIRQVISERPRPDTRRLIAINDGGYLRYVCTREEIHEQLEPLRNTDFFMILWGTFRGESCFYFNTRLGRIPTGGDLEFDRFYSTDGEGMDKFKAIHIDPLQEAVDYAHSIGIKLCASIRMDGTNPPPYNASPGPFFSQHPEYYCRDREGRPIPRLSLAFPEVRNLYLALFREALKYGVDGIAVVFGRAWPFVSYEAPVVDSFRQRYGVSIKEVSPSDKRWLRHKAGFVTEYVRGIRKLLDEEGRRHGRRLASVFQVGATIPGSLDYALDVESWIREEIVDHLILHPVIGGDVARGAVDVASRARGSKTRVYVDFYPRRYPAEMIRRKAVEYYEADIDGFCFWDTDGRMMRPSEWAMWKWLGHRDQLESWENVGRKYYRVNSLKTLNGYPVDPSWWTSGG